MNIVLTHTPLFFISKEPIATIVNSEKKTGEIIRFYLSSSQGAFYSLF